MGRGVAGPIAVACRAAADGGGTAAARGEVPRATRSWPTARGHRPGPDGGGVGVVGSGLQQGDSAWCLYEEGGGDVGPGEAVPDVGGAGVAVVVGDGVPGQAESVAQGDAGPGSALGAALGPYRSCGMVSTEGEATGGTSGSPLLTRREPPVPGPPDDPPLPRFCPPDAEATGCASDSPPLTRREPPVAGPSNEASSSRSWPLEPTGDEGARVCGPDTEQPPRKKAASTRQTAARAPRSWRLGETGASGPAVARFAPDHASFNGTPDSTIR